jgi:hypothetical protein
VQIELQEASVVRQFLGMWTLGHQQGSGDSFDVHRRYPPFPDRNRQLDGHTNATVHRLVSELVAWGFLERTDDAQYRVGVALRAISATADALPILREPADRTMEDSR